MTIEHITRANANVFEDLGLPDAENLKLRAQLMMEIRNFVNESGMTQTKAAMALKTTQPRLNEVLNGRIDKCTIDRLVQMLAEVGMHVNITITTDQAA
ncbi:MAG: helix-turn-helix domain-containing protein [Candidatus Thiodiazotropha sp. (ex Ustalcina ferruginea)]|nr:helix-turn-helix domain-containing protein [Candidatus Thiodiazotropha sp. (ex Ustalcina ferruginea)]